MSDTLTTFSQTCSMKPDQATRVSQMIASHAEFSGIITTINQDTETSQPSLVQQNPERVILVTFEIPCEGISMPNFYRELCNVLQPQESMVTVQREKGG